MTAVAMVVCPECKGAGMHVECANDGSHGCSHQFDREWPCRTCDGGGAATPAQAQEYARTHCPHGVHTDSERGCWDCDYAALRTSTTPDVGAGPPPF